MHLALGPGDGMCVDVGRAGLPLDDPGPHGDRFGRANNASSGPSAGWRLLGGVSQRHRLEPRRPPGGRLTAFRSHIPTLEHVFDDGRRGRARSRRTRAARELRFVPALGSADQDFRRVYRAPAEIRRQMAPSVSALRSSCIGGRPRGVDRLGEGDVDRHRHSGDHGAFFSAATTVGIPLVRTHARRGDLACRQTAVTSVATGPHSRPPPSLPPAGPPAPPSTGLAWCRMVLAYGISMNSHTGT